MNSEEAKRILAAHRLGVDDADEPGVRQALELARQDPGLDQWFQAQQRWHEAMRTGLRSLPAPAALRGNILAARPRLPALKIPRKPRRTQLFLMAASFLILGVFSLFWTLRSPVPDKTRDHFQSRMVRFALREYRMDILTSDPAQVRQYMRTQGAPADYALAAPLETIPVKGGARLSWQGHPVSMVCFSLPKEETLYLFILDQTALDPAQLPPSTPEMREINRLATASWLQAGKVYLLAAPLSLEALRTLLM